MKFIKNFFSTFISLYFPSIAAYRTHDREVIEYIEENTLVELNSKRILYTSPLLILIPVWGLRGMYEHKLAFVVILLCSLIATLATAYTSFKVSNGMKSHGNGILNRKKYYSKLCFRFWTIWFCALLIIGFSKLNTNLNGSYLYLFQLCLAFLPLISPKRMKYIGFFTIGWALILGINLLYYGKNEYAFGAIIFIFTNMILVFIMSYIIQKLNLSIAVMVAYAQQVGFLDQLTNLFNRRGYTFRMSEMVSEEMKASVIMVDVDYFKQYNDTFGHNKGDEILRAIANTIKGVTSPDSHLSIRYGGEEFAIICFNADKNVATIIAESIVKKIAELKIPTADTSVSEYLTVSIGIAEETLKSDSPIEEAVEKADRALYMAKEQGRNRIVAV